MVETPSGADQILEAGAREAKLGEDRLLLGGAGQPAKLGYQLADGADPAALPIGVQHGRDQAFEPLRVIPMHRGRIARAPPLPGGVGWLPRSLVFAHPAGQVQVRVERGEPVKKIGDWAPGVAQD